jgi:hypothetical protein
MIFSHHLKLDATSMLSPCFITESVNYFILISTINSILRKLNTLNQSMIELTNN